MQTPWKQTTAVEEWRVLSQVQVRLRAGGGCLRWPETPHLAPAPCSFNIKVKAKQSERIPMIPRGTHTHTREMRAAYGADLRRRPPV